VDDGHGPATRVTWGEDGQGDRQDWDIAWGSVADYGTAPLMIGGRADERHD
jgi:hypothetical protein